MKRFALALLIVQAVAWGQAPAPPPTTALVTTTTTMPYSVLQDIDAHWRSETAGGCGTLAAGIGTTDTSFDLTASVPAGTTITLDAEPMAVTVGGTTVTVARGTTLFPLATPATHSAGTQCLELSYATPWQMYQVEAMIPWTLGIVNSRAQSRTSFTFAATTTGSIATQ